jgi:hypothetical protein
MVDPGVAGYTPKQGTVQVQKRKYIPMNCIKYLILCEN